MTRVCLLTMIVVCLAVGAPAQITGSTTMPYFTPFAFDPTYGSNVSAPDSSPYQTTAVQWSGTGAFTPDVSVLHETDPGPPIAVNTWNLPGYNDLPSVIYPFGTTQRLRVIFTAAAGTNVRVDGFALGNFRQTTATIPSIVVRDAGGTVFWQTTNAVLPPASQPARRFLPVVGSAPEWILEIDFTGMATNPADVGLSEVTFSQGTTSIRTGTANQADAALVINGRGSLGIRGPFSQTLSAGTPLTLDWSGVPGSPIVLFADPALAATSVSVGCSGSVDIGNFPAVLPEVLFNGNLATFPDVLFRLDAAGSARQTFTVPLTGTGAVIALQGAILPMSGGPCGGAPVLTAAHLLTFP